MLNETIVWYCEWNWLNVSKRAKHLMINDIEIRRFVWNIVQNTVKYRVILCHISWCEIIAKTKWTPSIFASDCRTQLWHFYHTFDYYFSFVHFFYCSLSSPIMCYHEENKKTFWFRCWIERQMSLSRNRELQGKWEINS